MIKWSVVVGSVVGGFNKTPRRTASDKILREKAFNIAKNQKYDGYIDVFGYTLVDQCSMNN